MIYLDVTGRNDWSSTLPETNRSYFYPSASLSVLVNEMVDISPSLDLLKLRAGIAEAGNDTDPYSLINVMSNMEAWGGITRLSNQELYFCQISNLKCNVNRFGSGCEIIP